MIFNRENVVIGYDITNEYVQISYWSKNMPEPETLDIYENENLNIPLCLFKYEKQDKWLAGNDAVLAASGQEIGGFFLGKLLDRAYIGEKIIIEELEYEPVSLLRMFIKITLNIILEKVKKEDIKGIAFTISEVTQKTVKIISDIIESINLESVRTFIQGRDESIYYYLINQQQILWKAQVMVYDFSGQHIISYRFHQNVNASPQIAMIDIQDHPELNRKAADRDELFLKIAQETIGKNFVSSVFLLGDGFKEDWMYNSLKYLCKGRRVFRGNNLYSRGACYACRQLLDKSNKDKVERVFLGKDQIRINIGIPVMDLNKERFLELVEGGTNWYEVHGEIELILAANHVKIVLIGLDGRTKEITVVLDGMMEREPKTTRIKLELIMESVSVLRVNVTDMGFGDLFPASNQLFTKEINIYE